jgi:hypothetical protein
MGIEHWELFIFSLASIFPLSLNFPQSSQIIPDTNEKQFCINPLHLSLMLIKFREINPFDVWIWLKFSTVPSQREKDYIEELFNSWFYLGKLGAFNAENLQVQDTGLEISYMNYNQDGYENSLKALMHNMGELEYEGEWGRCWFDLGTSDAIAIDILVNAITQINEEYLVIEELYIGGENADWTVEDSESRPSFIYDN